MGWMSHALHNIEHGVEDVAESAVHETKSAAHIVEHAAKHGARSVAHAGRTVEHGVIHAAGLAERTVAGGLKTAGKTALTVGKGVVGGVEEVGSTAFHIASSVGSGTVGLAEDAFSFFNPATWSITTYILLGGGALILSYVVYEGFKATQTVGRTVSQMTLDQVPNLINTAELLAV